jgi:hypothetical protein
MRQIRNCEMKGGVKKAGSRKMIPPVANYDTTRSFASSEKYNINNKLRC